MYKRSLAIVLISAALGACANLAGSSGVVQIGPDMYMINSGVGVTSYATSTLRGQFYQQAAQFCTDRTRVLKEIDASSLETKVQESGRVELRFYCLLDSDYRMRR